MQPLWWNSPPTLPLATQERVVWQGYPSWTDHALLFFFMGIASVRTIFAIQVGEWTTVTLYSFAIVFFSSIAIFFHYLDFYHISSQRVRVLSGYRTRRTSELLLDHLKAVHVRRELFNDWFNLGSVDFEPETQGDHQPATITLKGIPDPEVLKLKVDILAGLPRHEPLT